MQCSNRRLHHGDDGGWKIRTAAPQGRDRDRCGARNRDAVVPGLIDTPLTRHHDRYAQAADEFKSAKPTSALEAEAKQKLIAKSPLGVPWIEPEAIAPAVVFLASDEACMVSGATYDVTGGDSANYNV